MKRSLLLLVFFAAAASAQVPLPDELLPPRLEWEGRSRQLTAPSGSRWITPAEASGFQRSPNYEETVSWLKKLVASSPRLRMTSIGKSAEGRDIVMVIASSSKTFDAKSRTARRKPLVLAQSGIHSGEIDGKDAGMMLLRELVHGRRKDLLEKVDFLFVPIFNVDGHERASRYGRINQRGPEVIGWRTNAQNLNLNRDYTKADSPEMKSMLRALSEWDPNLYIDLHVTDGSDYQYDITWGFNEPGAGWSPSIGRWLKDQWEPHVTQRLRSMGHIPATMVGWIDDSDRSKGLLTWTSDPRFSIGYGDARHLPTVIVENHSLKPYDQRVLGTLVFLEATLEVAASQAAALQKSIAEDSSLRRPALNLGWAAADTPERTEEFLGVESVNEPSEISGRTRTRYTGKLVTENLPRYRMTKMTQVVPRPAAYWISPAWSDVIERLKLHGIQMETITAPRDVVVSVDRLVEPKVNPDTFEGHARLSTGTRSEVRTERYPAGSVRITTDQPLGDLVMLLLEPGSSDSFLQWGFFHEILDRTEYAEAYVLEPLAEKMLAADPALAAEYRKKVADDEEFRKDSWARLMWFYSRTPYFDDRWLLYPVGREMRADERG